MHLALKQKELNHLDEIADLELTVVRHCPYLSPSAQFFSYNALITILGFEVF